MIESGLAYNVKIFNYPGGKQVRIYSKPLFKGGTKKLENEIELDKEKVSLEQLEKKKEKCQESSINRTIQSIYGIARANTWEYFLTLTFDPEKIDNRDYSLVTKKSTTWLNNIKKNTCPDMKYILVPELHADGKKWHLHGLLSDCSELKFVDSGKLDKSGNIIYNLINWRYGWSTVTKIIHSGRASSYIVKYINKDLCSITKGKSRYWASKNCMRSDDCLEVDLLTSEQINEFIVANSSKIQHMKTTEYLPSQQKVRYFELSN